MLNQTESILNHLQNVGPITPLEALQLYGCFRLGARIWDLKQQGIDIVTEIVEANNKHFASYRINRELKLTEVKTGRQSQLMWA